MALDPRQHLVLINGEDKTKSILKVFPETHYSTVTFLNGKSYQYSRRRVEWISNPTPISVENTRFIAGGILLSGVDSALRFGKWVKIFLRSGNSHCALFSSLGVQSMLHPDGRSTDLFAYFNELAQASSLRTEEDDSLLALKYRHLESVSRESVLFDFLQTRFSDRNERVRDVGAPFVIFPFGCNPSQKKAVHEALRHKVSMIQGPPGTGKTQTILNLIANLLLQGKKIAVVSNNNSATANVQEKLKVCHLDFISAFLGNNQNQIAFINGQDKAVVKLPILRSDQEPLVREEVFRLNQEIDQALQTKNDLAVCKQQIQALRLEETHFEKYLVGSGGRGADEKSRKFIPRMDSKEILKYWLKLEGMEKRQKSGALGFPKLPDGILSFLKPLFKRLILSKRFVMGLFDKLRLLIWFGSTGLELFDASLEERITQLQQAYYRRAIEELESKHDKLTAQLKGFDFEERLKRLKSLSMSLLNHDLGGRYNDRERRIFALEEFSRLPEEFLSEYPVVLSTTFSVITSFKKSHLFDYVIVDEASQVDLLTGVLSMGCAKRLVVVGDSKQLPNVLTPRDIRHAERIASKYDLPDYACFEKNSLLTSVLSAFPESPNTLLREHYRCHPKIIGFCNEKFYGGDLIVLTEDLGESDALVAYTTAEGSHARGTFNQRQIDEIFSTVLCDLGKVDPREIGIVSPYRNQVQRMKSVQDSKEIEIDTVHKFQGREKPTMILTTVANEVNKFVDNPNLLNVAISRAQKRFRVVVSKEIAEGRGNISDFIRYIQYSNGGVVAGKVRSVFDLLYRQYSEARREFLKKHRRISRYDSENLVYGIIGDLLTEECNRGCDVVSQFPLSMLVQETESLTVEESSYAFHPWTKVDFLIYRKVDKRPLLVVEVDGYAFHREGTPQANRDALKDSILEKCEMPILRLSTVGSNERGLIQEKLKGVMGN